LPVFPFMLLFMSTESSRIFSAIRVRFKNIDK
jgi:hypothetical protein